MEKAFMRAAKTAEKQIIIERSRFIGKVFTVKTEDEAREYINSVKKEHPFATHNCYAYVAERGAIARFSDDGEPQGTAGMPMLEVLKNRGLSDTLVVITRYFGGIKLGAGGLVRAYSSTAAAALDEAGVEELRPSNVIKVVVAYDKYSAFLKFCEKRTIITTDTAYGENVEITVAVPTEDAAEFKEKLTDFMAGKVEIIDLSADFFVYPR
ncbi:MAG: YigZ family protein [Clostridia bacterium]|nr:YigZ family protein [Clostridia bacterium]MBR1676434.1 YigZ family protein [Clostridia bacterium]